MSNFIRVEKCAWCNNDSLEQIAVRVDSIAVLRCRNCGLRMVEKYPIDIEKTFYNDVYFEKSKNNESGIGYISYASLGFHTHFVKYAFTRIFSCDPPARILDIGCATGDTLEIFDYFSYDTQGIDITEIAISECRKKGLNVIHEDATSLPFPDESFDVIVAFDFIEHISNPMKFLSEVRRILKRGGSFLYTTLNISSPQDAWYTTSLDHILYFDSATIEKSMSLFFNGNVSNIVFEINDFSFNWGVAKKGLEFSREEKEIIKALISRSYINLASREKKILIGIIFSFFSLFELSEEFLKDSPPFYRAISMIFQGKYHETYDYLIHENSGVKLHDALHWKLLSEIQRILKNSDKQKIVERENIISEKDSFLAAKYNELESLYSSESWKIGNKIVSLAVAIKKCIFVVLNFFKNNNRKYLRDSKFIEFALKNVMDFLPKHYDKEEYLLRYDKEYKRASFQFIEKIIDIFLNHERSDLLKLEIIKNLQDNKEYLFDRVNKTRGFGEEYQREIEKYNKIFNDAGTIHLELGSWTAFPMERVIELIKKENLHEFIRLDFNENFSEVDVVADCTRLPFRDNSIDRIASNSLFEHVPHPEKVISESYRTLSPGGMMRITVPFLFTEHDCPSDYLRYTPKYFQKICEETGFEKIFFDVQHAGGMYYVLHALSKQVLVDHSLPDDDRSMLEALHTSLMILVSSLTPFDKYFYGEGRNLYFSLDFFAIKPGVFEKKNDQNYSMNFLDRNMERFACLDCRKQLEKKDDALICLPCNSEFKIKNGIPIFL